MPYRVVDKIVNNTAVKFDSYVGGFEDVYRNFISVENWITRFVEYGRELNISEERLQAVVHEFENLPALTVEWNTEEQYAIRSRDWSSKEVYDTMTEIKDRISRDLDDGLVRATIIEASEV